MTRSPDPSPRPTAPAPSMFCTAIAQHLRKVRGLLLDLQTRALSSFNSINRFNPFNSWLALLTRCVVALALCVLVCGCRSALKPLPPSQTRTYQSLLEWTHQNGMPGAILLVQTPQTNFLGSVGWADVKRKTPMRPDHAFRIAS